MGSADSKKTMVFGCLCEHLASSIISSAKLVLNKQINKMWINQKIKCDQGYVTCANQAKLDFISYS